MENSDDIMMDNQLIMDNLEMELNSLLFHNEWLLVNLLKIAKFNNQNISLSSIPCILNANQFSVTDFSNDDDNK